MKNRIIILFVLSIFVGGAFSLSSVFAVDNAAPIQQQKSQIEQTPISLETKSSNSNNVQLKKYSLSSTSSEGEKVNASALTCIISNSGDYVIDLRLINTGTENVTITIYPSGKKLDLLPNQTKRYDLHLANEVKLLNLSVDDETQLQVKLPLCTTAGYSGSGASSNGYSQAFPQPGQSLPLPPPPPVPELSTLLLTLAGISGLMLVSRIRRD